MSRRGMLFLTLTGFALALGLAGTKPALAQAPQCERSDLTGIHLTNSCTGCKVTITSGKDMLCAQTFTDINGGLHMEIQYQAQGVGVDCNGNKYLVTSNLHLTVYVPSGGSVNFTLPLTVNAIGQGNAPDFRCKLLLHATVDANGNGRVEVDKASSDCECIN
jgi:hypothetical protein